MKKIFTLIILCLLLHYFYYYKTTSYQYIPENNIFDEHDYPPIGASFLRTGIAAGWSNMNIYKILDDQYHPKNDFPRNYIDLNIWLEKTKPTLTNVKSFKYPLTVATTVDVGRGPETIRIVEPFLDHPFLGSLIYSLNSPSANNFSDFKPEQYRYISAIIVATLTSLLLFIFSYQIYHSFLISFFSFVLYSSVTVYVLSSRYALFENLIIPAYLLSHSLLLRFFKNPQRLFPLFLAGVVTGLTYLIKESGIFILISVISLLISYRQFSRKNLAVYFVPTFLLISIYYLYSLYLAPNLTIKLLFDQANRGFFGPVSFLFSLFSLHFKNFPLDGYWFWGVVAFITLSFQEPKKHLVLTTGFLSFVFIFCLMAGQNYSWYSLPFLPFLVISSAIFLVNLLFKPTFLNLFIFYLLPFSSSFYWGYHVYRLDQNNVSLFRYLLFLLLIIFLLYRRFSKFSIVKYLWIAFILLFYWQTFSWNRQGFQYVLTNWGKLPPTMVVNSNEN